MNVACLLAFPFTMSKKKPSQDLTERIQSHYHQEDRTLSFSEFLQTFLDSPAMHCRGAAHYIRDTFDFFGSRVIESPTGPVTRFNLFDAEFTKGVGRVAGQEEAQKAIYRLLNNFVREGRVNRLILLHGPNGSAKTSIIHAIFRAMEHYSTLPEGTLYRFRWMFPTEKIARSHIGFGEGKQPPQADSDTYAHLPGEDLDAVLECELKDHPLLLIPIEERQKFFERLRAEGKLPEDHPIPIYLQKGDLCPKCREIHDALLSAYGGDSNKVLRHIQVQRMHFSLRYRRGMASVEPQLHVDAAEAQLTASRGLASLPLAIAHLALFEPRGPLVNANRGMLEYNDLLKRPIDTFKYLLVTCETGEVALERSTLFLDTAFLGSTNEMLLDSFKSYADFASFKGRLELIRVPYLRRVSDEIQIYKDQVPEDSLDRHLAPHTLHLAAFWAVLTRLRRPNASGFEEKLRDPLRELSPVEKAILYDRGETPLRLSASLARELVNIVPELYRTSAPDYEGRIGASAREIRMLLMNAAQRPDRPCVTPLGLFEEIHDMVSDKTVFEFLKQNSEGDYQNHDKILEILESYYLDLLEDEAAEAMGLVTKESYATLFNRYIQHVTHWLKKEKLLDQITGQHVPPDEEFMQGVESIICTQEENAEAFRKNLIGRIGAFVLDSQDREPVNGPPEYSRVFPSIFEKLKEDVVEKRRETIQKNFRALLRFMDGNLSTGESKETRMVQQMKDKLMSRYNYCEHCAKEAMAFLMKKRYQ
jgi:predicted Ser/Thr protein kinase